ncbi:MAG: Lrp/AsnC family transcriptional regulator [Minwuiales bacterium]|nr:Lrp/AsnC family transcriptional regulator [Minwuiales bacterium]
MIDLDEMDGKILRLLQADAGLSTADIAAKVGLSTSPCWRRIKRLRDAGVIEGQVTLVDPSSVGLKVTVFASVTLSGQHSESVAAFEAAVRAAPEILDCHAVTGDRDYMLRIVVPDIEAYDRFLTKTLLHLPEVGSINSRFALHRVKFTTALPL